MNLWISCYSWPNFSLWVVRIVDLKKHPVQREPFTIEIYMILWICRYLCQESFHSRFKCCSFKDINYEKHLKSMVWSIFFINDIYIHHCTTNSQQKCTIYVRVLRTGWEMKKIVMNVVHTRLGRKLFFETHNLGKEMHKITVSLKFDSEYHDHLPCFTSWRK